MNRILSTVCLTAAAALLATTASAAHLSYYAASLTPLNMSGVSGDVYLTYDGPEDDGTRSLLVQVIASGLEPGPHAGHVHGFNGTPDGTVKASIPPFGEAFNPNVDGDADGFTELAEGASFYGGILQTFEGLTANSGGMINYAMRFAVEAGSQLDDDLFSLDNRETVLHGITTDFAVGATAPFPGGDVETDMPQPGTFNGFLPIATGKFVAVSASDIPPVAPVPLPAGIFLMGAALGSLGAARKLRRKA